MTKIYRMLASQEIVLKRLGFVVRENHIVAYKSFNENYRPPTKWKIKSGSIITEHVDMDIWNMCSKGINVGTKKWCKENCSGDVWEVHIIFPSQICIPIETDGKIRVSKVKIIKKVKL